MQLIEKKQRLKQAAKEIRSKLEIEQKVKAAAIKLYQSENQSISGRAEKEIEISDGKIIDLSHSLIYLLLELKENAEELSREELAKCPVSNRKIPEKLSRLKLTQFEYSKFIHQFHAKYCEEFDKVNSFGGTKKLFIYTNELIKFLIEYEYLAQDLLKEELKFRLESDAQSEKDQGNFVLDANGNRCDIVSGNPLCYQSEDVKIKSNQNDGYFMGRVESIHSEANRDLGISKSNSVFSNRNGNFESPKNNNASVAYSDRDLQCTSSCQENFSSKPMLLPSERSCKSPERNSTESSDSIIAQNEPFTPVQSDSSNTIRTLGLEASNDTKWKEKILSKLKAKRDLLDKQQDLELIDSIIGDLEREFTSFSTSDRDGINDGIQDSALVNQDHSDGEESFGTMTDQANDEILVNRLEALNREFTMYKTKCKQESLKLKYEFDAKLTQKEREFATIEKNLEKQVQEWKLKYIKEKSSFEDYSAQNENSLGELVQQLNEQLDKVTIEKNEYEITTKKQLEDLFLQKRLIEKKYNQSCLDLIEKGKEKLELQSQHDAMQNQLQDYREKNMKLNAQLLEVSAILNKSTLKIQRIEQKHAVELSELVDSFIENALVEESQDPLEQISVLKSINNALNFKLSTIERHEIQVHNQEKDTQILFQQEQISTLERNLRNKEYENKEIQRLKEKLENEEKHVKVLKKTLTELTSNDWFN